MKEDKFMNRIAKEKYKCEYCGETFRYLNNYNLHRKKSICRYKVVMEE